MKIKGTFTNIRYMQYASTLAGSMMFSSRIVCLTWSSPALDMMKKGETPLGKVSDEQTSWIASLLLIGNLIGYVITTSLIDKFGQRSCLLFASMNMWIPWMVIAFSNSILWICVARLTLGLISAICILCSIMYIGEVSDQDIRGRSSTFSVIVGSFSNLFIYGVGPRLSFVLLTLSCMTISSCAFFLLIITPESPYYFARKGKMKEAEASVEKLSPIKLTPEELSAKMKKILDYTHAHEDSSKKMKLWDLISNKKYRKPLIAMIGVRTFTIFTGGVIMTSYFQILIKESNGTVSPDTASLLLGCIQVPSATLVSSMVDKVGRKPLLISSFFGTSLTLFSVGGYYFMMNVLKRDVTMIGWLPTVAFISYTVIKQMGVTCVPNILLGELFASKIKSVAVATLTFYGTSLNFFILRYFFPLSNYLGLHTVFWFFSICSLLASIFVFFFVPETKNKSFSEIQMKFSKENDIQTTYL